MSKINNIVWATDGSAESEEALNISVVIAKAYGSVIHGVFVSVLPETIISDRLGIPTDDLLTWMVKAEERSKSFLEDIGDKLNKQGVKFKPVILNGKPSEKIVEYAENTNAELITIGKRGLGLIDRILIGSTALDTLRKSHIPVLAVKKQEEAPFSGIKNILAPIDISENVDTALTYAFDLAEHVGASITAIYVFRLDTYTYEVPASVLDTLVILAQKELSKRIDAFLISEPKRASKVIIKPLVIHGISPYASIADYSDANDFDLIVINSHARKGFKKFILGSVTERVIHESSRPVLAINP